MQTLACMLCITGKSAYSCEVVNTYLVFDGYIIPKITFDLYNHMAFRGKFD